ncbi:hypothetical protein LZ198_16940 [Myxococcus sp. K15C18031901]|uniref:hypothetical protein n=1 Tax=Myxococcus dinghuensis TaxID=2906761 RepID=UPI0020A7B408|nr:hypothetical protein [Myxococcus dinghuensis]MCP3100558.1 hypothetical protein [Myxococcus dinghuensis]
MDSQMIEVMFNSQDLARSGLGGRDAVAVPLKDALAASGLGAVTGGGTGGGVSIVDVEVAKERVPEAVRFLKQQLRQLGVPPSTVLNIGDSDVPIGVYEPWGEVPSRLG